jgi:phospholipase C
VTRALRVAGLIGALAMLGAAAPNSMPSLQSLIRARVRYVFVIYQENRSFDHYFGTFPGADGIYTPAALTHGFTQYNPVAKRETHAFRVVAPQLGLLNNARSIVEAGIHAGAMDGFVGAQTAWAEKLPIAARQQLGMTDPAQAASVGDEAMAHVDCDTIPYLWMYASRFALFDSFFQGVRAPSAPSNVEIIAAQNGETEYKRYGTMGPPYTQVPIGDGGRGVPMFVDLDPAWGPYNAKDSTAQTQVDQTYATVLLNLEGVEAGELTNYTQDVDDDIRFLTAEGAAPIEWTWYQQGFDNPADPQRLTLVAHHLAPHYFGYIVNNPTMNEHVADITRFESDVEHGKLAGRGLYYLKGGFGSNLGLLPSNAAPHTFAGDDDHPGESDSQIAQADVAALVNVIARSKYWRQSAIVITWDDPGGFWDHVPPPAWLVCPDGHPCGDGQRVPLLLISPYARTGVVHERDDQASVIKFVERLFNRAPLADLPDEARFMPFGPRDGTTTTTGDLTGGFDAARLSGARPPISATQAEVPDDVVRTIPAPWSCRSIGVRPIPPPRGIPDAPPAGFDPRVLVVPLPRATASASNAR